MSTFATTPEKIARAFTRTFGGRWQAFEQVNGTVDMHFSVDADRVGAFKQKLGKCGFITTNSEGTFNITPEQLAGIGLTVKGR